MVLPFVNSQKNTVECGYSGSFGWKWVMYRRSRWVVKRKQTRENRNSALHLPRTNEMKMDGFCLEQWINDLFSLLLFPPIARVPSRLVKQNMYSGVRREWNLEYAYRTTEINFSFVYVSFPPVEDPFQAITHHTDRPSDRDNICRDTSLFCCHALPPKWKRRGSFAKRTPTLICLINI